MHVGGVFFLTLLGLGFERRLLVMAAVLAVLNPLANLIAIPVFQQDAAAFITSATEAIVAVWLLALTPKELRGAASPVVVVKLLVAAIPAAACLWLVRSVSVVIGVPLAGIVYVLAALALGTVPAGDLRATLTILSRSHPGSGKLSGRSVASPRTVER
jgi:peptidoglycan biosynthesis protein MviN/MurJ (putative lipid II flippase)